jgi:hypothetical protein
MSPPPDSPVDEPGSSHRGMIPRDELPFLPKIKWRFWAPVLVVLVGFPLVWNLKRDREARRLRERLLREHTALTATLGPDYRAVRQFIEASAFEAVGPYAGDLRDANLTLEGIARESVLYGRVRVHEVHSPAEIAASIRHRYPDQLCACLGLEPLLARELFDKGAFLLPSFVDAVRGADSTERLHALREDLIFRLRRDTPLLVNHLRRRYFILAVDEAHASIDGPTRVFIYDLPARRVVLRARGQGTDLRVIPFQMVGLPSPPPRAHPFTGGSVSGHDCSVANTARTVLGIAPMGMLHAPDLPRPVADAGSTDAATVSDAHP